MKILVKLNLWFQTLTTTPATKPGQKQTKPPTKVETAKKADSSSSDDDSSDDSDSSDDDDDIPQTKAVPSKVCFVNILLFFQLGISV